MPFYLVSQSLLVEADDEVSAAHQALARVRKNGDVAFTVKFDENTSKRVVISQSREESNAALVHQASAETLSSRSAPLAILSGDDRKPPAPTVNRPQRIRWQAPLFVVATFALGVSTGLASYLLLS